MSAVAHHCLASHQLFKDKVLGGSICKMFLVANPWLQNHNPLAHK